MHARDLVELAAVVVEEAGRIARTSGAVTERSLRNYWRASRQRQERWARDIRAYGVQLEKVSPNASAEAWRPLRPVLDEILLSEVPTRVVTAVLSQRDRQFRGSRSAAPACGPVVHAIFLGHLEARHRALNLMAYGQGFAVDEGVNMNRLRRRCDHWTDLLLAALVAECDVEEYAIDFLRVQRLVVELDFQGHEIVLSPTWSGILEALKKERFSASSSFSPNPDLNRQIEASLRAWTGQPPFPAWRVRQSPWVTRLFDTAQETECLLEELLRDGMGPVDH